MNRQRRLRIAFRWSLFAFMLIGFMQGVVFLMMKKALMSPSLPSAYPGILHLLVLPRIIGDPIAGAVFAFLLAWLGTGRWVRECDLDHFLTGALTLALFLSVFPIAGLMSGGSPATLIASLLVPAAVGCFFGLTGGIGGGYDSSWAALLILYALSIGFFAGLVIGLPFGLILGITTAVTVYCVYVLSVLIRQMGVWALARPKQHLNCH